jgi:hypothetical protein
MKYNKTRIACVTAALWMIASNTAFAKVNTNKLDKMYTKAVEDANLVEQSEIDNTLTAITPSNADLMWSEDNKKILVATWKSQEAYDKYIKPYSQTSGSEQYVTWVTAVPEVKQFCQTYTSKKKKAVSARLDRRLKQHLGLNHTWSYDVFVEMWVSPDDLFRPCTDPETTDTSCQLNFGDSVPVVKNIKDYKDFYQNLYYSSFRSAESIVPWTGLGYTYDWANNNTEVGASEFILVPNAPYEIHKVYTTADYCKAG